MNKFYQIILMIFLSLNVHIVWANTSDVKPVRVAVFIPLYTDSTFANPTFTSGSNLPKYTLPGLEFYNGVMMAIDSLNQEGTFAEVHIYDSKSAVPLVSVLSDTSMSKLGLIIAAITNTAELKTFSEFALAQNIPLISATFPNYVGLKQNPFVALLNSSFEAHIQGLHKHMLKYYSNDTIVAVSKKGGQYETFIKNYFTSINTSAAIPLKLRWVNMDPKSISIESLRLDTLKNNVLFVASPLESFGVDIVKSLCNFSKYKTTAIGMPTWDNLKQLDILSCKNVEIVYSTPFNFSKNSTLNDLITNRYKEKFFSRPSDMVFKGYESLYHFTKLLVKYRGDLVNHLSDKDYTLFNEFKFEPVKVSKTSIKPDFVENKRLYFIKKKQGEVKNIY